MSLFDKASLMLTPSGVKTDKIHSQKPSNGNGDFTFDRNLNTATRVNKDGYIESVAADVPRLNYPFIDGVVQDCPSLILEPARTNKFFQSNNFNTTWNLASGLTLTGGQSSPLTGGVDAWKLASDGSSGFLALNQNVSVTGTNSFSIYAKAGTNSIISLRSLSGVDVRAQFDLSNGSLIGASNTTSTEIKPIKDNWYRCTVTFNASNSAFYIYPMLQGTSDAGYIYIQNAQLEQGSYPTSYIPTSGSTVTRSAETANGAGTAAEFNSLEGVLFAEIAALPETGRIALNDSTTSNNIRFVYNSGIHRIDAVLYNSSNQAVLSYVLPIEGSFNKIAFKYKASDFSLYVDGFEVNSKTNGGTTFSGGTLSELDFDDGGGANPFYGNTKQLAYFKEALTDSELEALTSWTSFNEMATGQEYSIQ